jgi:hypothetical protein
VPYALDQVFYHISSVAAAAVAVVVSHSTNEK